MNTLAVPLALEQEWFFTRRIASGGVPILINRAFNINGPLDVDRLVQSFETVVRRHQGMRTTLGIDRNGEPSLAIHPELPEFPLALQAITARSREQFEEYARRAAKADAATWWNPVQGPAYRIRLLRRSAEEHILLGVFDHLFFDDRGVELFFHYLWSEYSNQNTRETDLEGRLDLADSIRAERERYADRAAGVNAEYWAPLYAQIPESVPRGRPENREEGREYESSSEIIDIEGDQFKEMMPAISGAASAFASYVAAFAYTVLKLTKLEVLAIYTSFDNRRPVDRGIIGNFSCVRPILIQEATAEADSYLQQINEQLFRSLAHRHLDGPTESRLEIQATGHPALRSPGLNYMRADGAEILVSPGTGITLRPASYFPRVPTHSAETMILGVREEANSVRFNLRYTKEFISAEQAHSILSSCITQLASLRAQQIRNGEK